MNSGGSISATFLPGLGGGPTPCASPAGPTTSQSGPEAAHASPSLPLADRWVSLIRGIYSRRGAALSRAALLQSSLEGRLRAHWDVNGSPEYALKWRHWAMPHGAPICALRGSRRRTCDKGFTGWPTPQARDGVGGLASRCGKRRRYLNDYAMLAPWATPTTRDAKDGDCDLTKTPDNGLLGRQVLLASNAPTGKRGALTPRFSLWLQGYPETWHSSGARATRSTRGSPPNSSPTAPKTRTNHADQRPSHPA